MVTTTAPLGRVIPGPKPLTVQIFTDLTAVESIWRNFEKTADYTVFQSFDWLMEWYRYIGVTKNLTPVIVVGSVNQDICFLLPLAIDADLVRRLIWLGVDLADYNAPLLATNFRFCVPPGQFASVWEQIIYLIQSDSKLQFDVIELDKMPISIGSHPNPFCDLPVLTAEYSAHAATLVADSWEQFYASKVSTSGRQTDRRKLRRLAECGEVQFIQVEEPTEIKHTLTVLIEQKRASYARMRVSDMFEKPGHIEFYQAIAANPCFRSVVHLTRVDVGGCPVATGFGLRFQSRYYLLLHSYKEEYAKYSPGRHHIRYLLEWAISHGMQIFDFTIGDEPYKDNWADNVSPLLRYYDSRTVRGRMVVAFRVLRHHAVHWYKLYQHRRRA